MGTARRIITLSAWLGLLLTVVIGLPVLAGDLPPVTDPGAWSEWSRGRHAVDVVFAIGGVVVHAAAWYLLGSTILGALLRVLRATAALRVVDALTIPPVRRLLQFSLGMGLAAAGLAASGSGASTASELTQEPTAASIALGQQQAAAHAEVLRMAGDDGGQFMRYLGDAPDAADVLRLGEGVLAAEDAGRTWEVRSGEHFWGIAASVLEEAWGRAPSDAEVIPYWKTLISANDDRLPDPGNPDLLFPGQELVVPAPPASDG